MWAWASEAETQGNKHLRYDEDSQGSLCRRSISPANFKERVVTKHLQQ